MDAAVIRLAAYPEGLVLPPWPDPTSDDGHALVAWVREVWPLPGVAEAIEVASPDLADVLTTLCENPGGLRPQQVRRAAEALLRYLLRWTSRATPFGLFAGVAPADLALTASAQFGARHTAVSRPDSTWLTDTIDALERRPELLRQLPVQANNLGFARGGDWVLPCQPCAEGPVSDVSVRHTAAVRMVLQEARTPVAFGDLLVKLAAEYPQTPDAIIADMLTELVHRRILLTALRPPMTVTDPLTYVTAQLEGLKGAPAVLDPGRRRAVDLRLDCSVSLPPAVTHEIEAAAAILVRLAPGRPAWQSYHVAFIDRYGPGALVAVRELVDPDRGLGYPAGYRGSPGRTDVLPARRDIALAALAHKAAQEGRVELVVDDAMVAELENDGAAGTFPHTELRVSLSAPTLPALDAGDFTLTVASASRHAGTSVGRFLHLLDTGERDRIAEAYHSLPTSTADAMTVQLSVPSLTARTDGLARTPNVLPVLSLGEHRHPREAVVDLDDLAVTADAHRLILVSLSHRRAVEPLMLNAVDLRHGAHPLARFLCEVSTGTATPCTPFFWGRIADRFAFLPRVRYRRTILSPARWNLTAATLPASNATPNAWAREFHRQRHSQRIPDVVRFGDDDVLIRLDLTERAHMALLRRHLDRVGKATLIEAPEDDGWIGGRPHEIVVPLASTAPPRPAARRLRPDRIHRGSGHVPGDSPWLYAKLFGHPARQNELLTVALPTLLSNWEHGNPDSWWFIRYDSPAPHLRIRLPLHAADRYGPAVRTFGRWARTAADAGLLRDVTLDSYRPEIGRFGTGPALAAAETVFAADSAVAVTQLRTTTNAHAATAAGLIDIATGFLDTAGPHWLVQRLSHGGVPALDRNALEQARQPANVPPPLLERRRTALTSYRALLDGDIDAVLADLLHLHHARMIGIDADSERTCMRLARAVAQTLIARGARGARRT
ncbi:lantibiotic dehydratase [Streptosporangium sp. NBC_01756]|uniref:lantibiotic dehydratase n=1 Tax=Streptosporangium sp. NBC_01756 TaxID=2975950 RepID=UPI002DD81A58|nr:lantibiotic dehydratase [Streptosporangium sp. NBC_01756]WSC86221.1 lantibiotic dehydratase [Streptosporangium sp. NBC_01756]